MAHTDPSIRVDDYMMALGEAGLRLRRRWLLYVAAWIGGAGLAWVLSHRFNIGLATLIGLPYLLYIPYLRRRVRPLWATGAAMRALAAENGMRYIDHAKPNYIKHFQPAVARLGIWERHEQIVKGTYDALPFETYVDTFRHPFAYRFSRVATRVYRVQLPKELPHIFMRNLQSSNQYLGALPRHFDDDQRVDLEGNFHRSFTVYTHRRTVTDALSLLAPNVMETLVRANRKFDVEFVGNHMYLYSPDYLVTTPDLQADFKTIDALVKHLKHHLKSWKFVIPNNRRYPYLVSRPGFGTLALGGKHYNKAWAFIAFYTVYSAVRIAAQPQYRLVKIGIVVVSDLVMGVVLLIFRRRYQLARRNVAR